ncbi:YkvA family protein [Salininema proteolyticum]|uniref:YkvA family protein n=1 Tax=Salininema proteolyticum TaxID=1607685 RepID=A0ABV8U0K5_9ACTN
MDSFWNTVAGAVAAILALWVLFAAALLLYGRRYGVPGLKSLLRLLPDVLTLLRRLATEKDVPLRTRIGLWALLGYLLLPFDLIPDFLPVIGWADDVVIAVLALRLIFRSLEPEGVRRHWRGSEDSLAVLLRLTGTA